MSLNNLSPADIWQHKWDADRNAGYREPFSFTEVEANEMKGKTKAIILPGNGVDDVSDCMWYPWMKEQLKGLGIPCVLTTFPDPMVAREKLWKGFVVDCIGIDENTILIGHSSGAACALRIAEENKVKGVILLSAYYTDLGDSNERKSGYFSRPWQWEAIKNNAQWVLQFHSQDDHLVPIEEARFVHEKINSDFHEMENQGHFQKSKMPKVFEVIKTKIQS